MFDVAGVKPFGQVVRDIAGTVVGPREHRQSHPGRRLLRAGSRHPGRTRKDQTTDHRQPPLAAPGAEASSFPGRNRANHIDTSPSAGCVSFRAGYRPSTAYPAVEQGKSCGRPKTVSELTHAKNLATASCLPAVALPSTPETRGIRAARDLDYRGCGSRRLGCLRLLAGLKGPC